VSEMGVAVKASSGLGGQLPLCGVVCPEHEEGVCEACGFLGCEYGWKWLGCGVGVCVLEGCGGSGGVWVWVW